jgi:hypothetical protein
MRDWHNAHAPLWAAVVQWGKASTSPQISLAVRAVDQAIDQIIAEARAEGKADAERQRALDEWQPALEWRPANFRCATTAVDSGDKDATVINIRINAAPGALTNAEQRRAFRRSVAAEIARAMYESNKRRPFFWLGRDA